MDEEMLLQMKARGLKEGPSPKSFSVQGSPGALSSGCSQSFHVCEPTSSHLSYLPPQQPCSSSILAPLYGCVVLSGSLHTQETSLSCSKCS